ncbi:nectin-3-like [Salvelinus fontinalis]|uniref:nectin-3-like n=1 Tax=Salvelinus fontinalis TaxID=8038 RepID=UPI0024855F5E|nr:nectin-3-like [Salvelinus fontinalis]XP_055734211.1 nectin-3-like [Salvelinus fontinalis]XP_055734212.1 nectin-3-like [Salvelinus fontinalis]XP_055734213.1 nectin-3-like [Salvelinus fontinalis]
MLRKLCCVILLIIQRDTESTQVIGGWRTVVQGEDVDLYCRLIETTEDLEQITWQKSTAEETQNHNFMLIHPNGGTKFIAPNGLSGRVQFIGNPSENLGSIRITAVRLLDEGTFTCIFSVFPSGAYITEILLTVLVPPVVSVTVDVAPVIGENEVVLATCVAAGAKPQAEVTWKTGEFGSLFRTVTNSTQHTNGTTTVLSHLLGVPTKAANQQQVQCVVNQSALATEKTYNYSINIYYPPQSLNITLSETSKATVLLCVADGNPHPNYTWSRVVQPWPGSSVRAEGDKLHFLSLSSELNGLFVCEASNPYGRATGFLYVHTSSETSAACWVLLVILCLIVSAALGWFWWKYGQFPWSSIMAKAPEQTISVSSKTRRHDKVEEGEDDSLAATVQTRKEPEEEEEVS